MTSVNLLSLSAAGKNRKRSLKQYVTSISGVKSSWTTLYSDSYCDDRRMVDMVTAAVYHTSDEEEGGGLDWVKKLEQKE